MVFALFVALEELWEELTAVLKSLGLGERSYGSERKRYNSQIIIHTHLYFAYVPVMGWLQIFIE